MSSVEVKDNGYAKLLQQVRGTVPVVRVGVFGERAARVHAVSKKREKDSKKKQKKKTNEEETDTKTVELITLGQLADWLENGNETMPGRRWLSGYVEANKARILDMLNVTATNLLAGKLTNEKAMRLIGLQIVGDIKQRIANGLQPPNAESTIARKGSSTPLIDTGQFRNSIASEVLEVKE